MTLRKDPRIRMTEGRVVSHTDRGFVLGYEGSDFQREIILPESIFGKARPDIGMNVVVGVSGRLDPERPLKAEFFYETP